MTHGHLSRLSLGSLFAFEAAARLGSFKEAAQELGVTPAAISHQIKALEAQLGAMLFDRMHRALRLTRVGRRLGAAVRKSFDGVERELSDLRDEGFIAVAETLGISAAPSFAVKWLAPRLHRFQARRPAMEIHLEASEALIDLTRVGDVDVLVRYGMRPSGRRMRSLRLWDMGQLVAVCSPALARRRFLKAPKDILKCPLLRTAAPRQTTKQRAARGAESGWDAWFAAAGIEAPEPSPQPLFGSTQLALEAAAAGRGFVLAPEILVRDDLKTGVLAQPFKVAVRDPFSYWLVFRESRAGESKIRSFLSWIVAEAESPNA